MVMALVVPVLANGLRAFGTIYAAHITSVEQATGYDHIVYGWIFFGLVMAAVLAIGWKWFDRDPRARWFDPAALPAVPRHSPRLLPGAASVLAVDAAFPPCSVATGGRAQPLADQSDLPKIPGAPPAP